MKQYLNFESSKVSNYSLKHHFSGFYRKIELFLVVILCLAFLVNSKINHKLNNKISYFFVNISLPIVKIISFPINSFIDLTVDLEGLTLAKKENKILQKENEKLRLQVAKDLFLADENRELKEILKFVATKSANFKMAKIKGKNSPIFNHQLFLETKEGLEIKEGSAVVNNIGLLGRAINVDKNKARLLLLTDANSKIPVIASKSRVRGILVGNNSNLMEIEYLPINHNIEIGDLIFTSSDADQLPPSILVGIVKNIDGEKVFVETVQNIVNIEVATIIEY